MTACSWSTLPLDEPSGKKVDEKTPVIVMTYNIRMNTPDDGENAWPKRKDKVIGLLRFHKAEIFGVQEALPEQVQELVDGFPEFDHVGVGRDDGISKGEHMCIFYNKLRFERLGDGNFWLSPTPDNRDWDGMLPATAHAPGLNSKTG